MQVDYYSKYLKYKTKYLELKEQIGSAVTKTTKTEKEECEKHGHIYCSTLAIGCHWNGKNCVNNTCYKNNLGNIRGQNDCTITMGCTWDSNKNKCVIKK
jgi:hypothetical protein